MATNGPAPIASTAIADIPDADRVGRLGVMLVRALLAQAGIRNEETSPGEDHAAVDLTIHLPSAAVTAQVKSGRARPTRGGYIAVSVTEAWRKKWSLPKLPIYMIYVRVTGSAPDRWCVHGARTTTVHAHAYWVRIDNWSTPTVRVPLQNRLCLDTFSEWHDDVEAAFGKAG